MKLAAYGPAILIVLILLAFLLAGLAGYPVPMAPPKAKSQPSLPKAGIPLGLPLLQPRLWIDGSVPEALRNVANGWDLPEAESPTSAQLQLAPHAASTKTATWVYALVAPFPTVVDGVRAEDLISSWRGKPSGPFAGRPILMDSHTLEAFATLWGDPDPAAIRSLTASQLLDAAWGQALSWAIIPFDELEPRWKVLAVDGVSPLDNDFQQGNLYLMQSTLGYPLRISFGLTCSGICAPSLIPRLPATNRDPAKLTTVMMTGVTALVRATEFTMQRKGLDYPGRDIGALLAAADITHISNEVAFNAGCPAPDPAQQGLVFCSNPEDIELLRAVGTDVVELTGNHLADYGSEATLDTLALYEQNGMRYYGGGKDLQDATKPLLITNHGNKIAFIGCNAVDIGSRPTATADRPGAAPCDYGYLMGEIQRLDAQGYVVIATFQYYETYVPQPFQAQIDDFRLLVAAGASIVQGSQAHYPQTMEFRDGAFIHYGLGNLFFDQMGTTQGAPTREEFMDRHVMYDGRYIGTELLTALLEDYARPRPMTEAERATFLSRYFALSGWKANSPN
jgi:hypothetical protein